MKTLCNSPITHVTLYSQKVRNGAGVWRAGSGFEHVSSIFGMEGRDRNAGSDAEFIV